MASDPGTSHADLQTTKQTAWEGETLFQDCGCQTLVHPTQTHRHPKKLHERKEKPVHHGFLNKEAYPPLQDHGHQTLVHPTQTCRHPNNSPERMGKPVLHGFNNWLFLWIFIREVIIYLVSKSKMRLSTGLMSQWVTRSTSFPYLVICFGLWSFVSPHLN